MRYGRQVSSEAVARVPAGVAIHTCPSCGRPHHFHAMVPGDHTVCASCRIERPRRKGRTARRRGAHSNRWGGLLSAFSGLRWAG